MTLCYNRANVGWRRMPFQRYRVVCVWPLSASCCAQVKRDAPVFLTVREEASVRRHGVGFDVLEGPYSPRRVARAVVGRSRLGQGRPPATAISPV